MCLHVGHNRRFGLSGGRGPSCPCCPGTFFKRQSYGLALLDYKMPGMNGVELYRHLKQERAETVGILVTAFAARDTINEATEAGIRQVIPKPVDFGHLIPIIKEVAGKA